MSQPLRIPILTYHSHRILDETYAGNDHLALAADLASIDALGFRVVPLRWIVEWVLGSRDDAGLRQSVALTFDDGADFDFFRLPHPRLGSYPGFLELLRRFRARCRSSQPTVHATSFVIASPTVRVELDRGCLLGRGWVCDHWWGAAIASGLLDIQNHSFDHNHAVASQTLQKDNVKGSFLTIDSFAECDGEVRVAAEGIQRITGGPMPDLFAYPYGESSPYLREHYLPENLGAHHTIAAFTASGGYVTRESPRWALPRFVCGAPPGDGWRSAEELAELLRAAL